MSHRVLLGVLLLSVICGARALDAQQPDTACSYRACALRVEPRGLGTAIVRGAEGEVVARVGMWGARPALPALVSRSDSAVSYAGRYQRLAPRGAVLSLAGSLLFVIPAVHERLGEGATIGIAVGGSALTVAGTVLLVRAQRALSRSIWWHNEALAR